MADNTRRLSLEEVVGIINRRSIPEPNTGCILWEGGTQHVPVHRHPAGRVMQPYGFIRLRGKMTFVHRVMFEAVHGPIPKGTNILHRCDVRLCCNPAHLFAGTNDENHADKARKDRGAKKLTVPQSLEIQQMARSQISQAQIAKHFCVAQSTVSRIVSGHRRPHVRLSPE